MRKVTLLAVGGTIAMAADQRSGAVPAHGAEALLAAAGVEVAAARSVRSLPGVHLTPEDALAIAREAVAAAEGGDGVVVTTGTDTLEELAVLTGALNGAEAPIVFTGAIRPASSLGADGPANLADAVAVAASAPAGTYVVFAGEIHAAREARKTDSTSPRAFSSPRTGPVGYVASNGDGPRATRACASHGVRPRVLRPERLDFAVPIIPTYLGDDGGLLRAVLATEPDGLLLVALGAGHISPGVLAALRSASCPVAICVRPERGELLRATYGFEGSEADVRATGAIDAATLSPQAARVLLLAALGAGLDVAEMRSVMACPA